MFTHAIWQVIAWCYIAPVRWRCTPRNPWKFKGKGWAPSPTYLRFFQINVCSFYISQNESVMINDHGLTRIHKGKWRYSRPVPQAAQDINRPIPRRYISISLQTRYCYQDASLPGRFVIRELIAERQRSPMAWKLRSPWVPSWRA